jgi:hypothetical protein
MLVLGSLLDVFGRREAATLNQLEAAELLALAPAMRAAWRQRRL